MATEKEASLQSCASDPNFAVICSFLNQFAASCGIAHPTFSELQDMLEDTQEVSQILIDLHIKLLRKARKSFTADKWEKALAKFCHTYSQQDGWELERFGYKKARLGVKVKLLKVLLETQFDVNGKFKSEVNKVGAKDLRLEPLGRDQNGFQYWCQFDKSSHVRIYREDLDDETWELVASDRDGLVKLIDSLSNGEGQLELNSILNEDSTSQEIEKPITDTGQEDGKLDEAGDDDDEVGDEDDGDDEEEEEIEEEEEVEEEEEGDDEEELKEENEEAEQVEEKKQEIKLVKEDVDSTAPKILNQEKAVELTTNVSKIEQQSLVQPVEENISSLTGVDLSIKSDSKKYLTTPNDYYAPVPERPYIPERNSILSQMSARFNDMREAEDLSLNSAKKLKLDDDQPMMLVKKDIVVSDAIEDPVRFVSGPGSGEDCKQGNVTEEPEFSEVIEEPVQYVVGQGMGAECDIGNPIYNRTLESSDSEINKETFIEEEPEFSEVIEEPLLLIVGLGSGAECGIGNPRIHNESDSRSASTMAIECSLESLSLTDRELKFSDVIEEPVMFVHGSGSGQDCLTGNPDEVDESIEDKSPEKKPKLWSIDAICSSEKLLDESLKQNTSGSAQKDPESEEGSSKMSEDNSNLNCTKGVVVNEENVSAFNLSNNINSNLKPFSGAKPILENIPIKDKPPDSIESSDIDSCIPEVSNNINSRNCEKIENSSNCTLNDNEELGTNEVLKAESVPSTKIVQASSDISSDNCSSEEKSPLEDLPSTTDCTIKISIKPGVSESNLKSFSEDNSRSSIISEDLTEDKKNSNVSGDLLENNSSNLCINEESEKCNVDIKKSAQRNPSELFDASSNLKLDVDTCPNVNNVKSNSKRPKGSRSNKNNTSISNKSKIGDGEFNCQINNSVVDKLENDSKINSYILDKKNLINCENGSKNLSVSNCSVVCEELTDVSSPTQNFSTGKALKPKSSKTTTSSSDDQLKSGSDKSNPLGNNPVTVDKNEEKRKNVMLTNIIEVCLDNDNFSKDNTKSGLKGQLNAKFNDLFSAKNLLEPSIKSTSKETCNDLTKVSTPNIAENCSGNLSSDEKIKTHEEPKSNVNVNISDENSDKIKQEENIKEEDLQDTVAGNSESENKINPKNVDSIKSEEIKEENPVKNSTRGRKSRTNSINNDEETEIPNKIRKTDSVQVTKARRVSRRNTLSTSQNEVCLEPEDDKVVSVKGSSTKSKNEAASKKDPITEEKTEIKIEQNNENDKAGDDILKKEDTEEGTNEITKNEVDDINSKSNQDKKDCEKNSVEEKKGLSLASFSLEQPLEDGPVLGKPPEFKPQPSRKRRNSRKLSRSEEDGGELDEEDEDGEEAGGKKPRLRAKTRRSKGTPSSTKHVQPEDSSSDDNQAEENADAHSNDKRRSRGRPMKKKGPAMLKSKTAKAKETERHKEKGSDSDEESNSETDNTKQAPVKKETKKKQPPNKVESEKEEKKIAKKTNEKEDKKQLSKKEAKSQMKGKGKSRGRPKKEIKSNQEEADDTGNEGEEEEDKSTKTEVGESKPEEENDSKAGETEEAKPRPKKGRPKKQKTLLGLMESDLIHSKPSPNESEGSRVRQSRRIAQIKIKEEAERRAIEEATMMLTMKEVKKKPKEESKLTPKKQKKKKGKSEKVSEEEDETFKEPVEEKKKGRKKKKKKGLTYDINKPWQSSSDSSSEEAEEEEEHFEEEDDEEDIRAIKVVSDHEFSPESDLEKDEAVEPIRRARTAKKVDEDEVKDQETEATEDYPCKKCGQPDHPEWILLCDKCDSGYHASCLRPTLMLIPEGDWFCPPCQHLELVSKLKETLRAFEKNTKRRENEELRKKRLAYVGISLANVLPTQEKSSSPYSGGRRIVSESSESSSEESETSDDEPVYQLRQRRAALQANYRFNDYDELINSAIQDEMEAVKGAGNMGRGKDIANIVEAEKKAATEEGANIEEEPKVDEEEEEQGENWRPPVVPKNTSLPSLRKKPKKLTDLDKQSEDDADSDEDFKGSSEEEEFSSNESGDSDDSIGRRQPVRRSSRARISRIDKEFINDDSESSDEPRRKKTRRIWASSSSESSDTTWGRRKRKTKTYSRIRSSKSSKKKKKMVLDSDSDRPKKIKIKRPKIKYGLSEDEGEPLRRTRGKKMSYLEVAGSDTEEEVIARSRKLISEEEEEFVPEKEDVGDDENEAEEVEPVEEIEEEEEEDEDDDDNDEDDNEEEENKAEENVISEDNDKEKKETEEIPQEKEKEIVKVPKPETGNKESENKEPEIETEKPVVDEEEDDDQVEEEEIEEEVEEEVEEEEEEEEEDEDSPIEEVKNLVREKTEEPKGIIQSPIKLGTGVSIIKVPVAPAVGAANSNPRPPSPPTPPTTTAIPTPVIKEEKKEEKKEPTPAIRLVPSAKLLDPNKRRPPEESVIRGMLGGGGYYRTPPMQAPGRQPFRQRFPDQQRYLYQPPPTSHHQFFPGGAFYAGEDYVVGSGYEEQMDPNVPGGDEEGVFSGLVSYFSSQREDNLDS